MYNLLKLAFACTLLTSCATNYDMISSVGHYSETIKDDPVTVRRSMEMRGVIIREESLQNE